MGASVASGSSKKQPEPEINITPLVDVVLVLLIIFMVIAPELEHGERVELPAIVQPDDSKSKLDPITVTMTARGNLFFEKEQMTDVAALEARLNAVHLAEPDRRIVLKGDATVGYAKMRDTFAACQRAGFKGVALSVSQKGKGKGEES
jgi:biopolymer transport protein TolR